MKKWITALVMALVLIPLQVKAFELEYEGRKDFWTNVHYNQMEDETGQLLEQTHWDFGHSLEFNFHGQGEDGYVMGYITDNPDQMDAVYLDAALGDYKLEWANYKQALQIPTWFNLQQEFRGARLGYLGRQDRMDLIGVRGENYLREEVWVREPGDEQYNWSLKYANVETDSVRIWLNGVELTYGADFYVLPGGVVSFKIPFKESSQVYIRYVEEGMGYLVYGGRYERFFQIKETQNLAGSLIYLHNQDLYSQNLLGTEWFYQPNSLWSMDLSLGAVQQEPQYFQDLELVDDGGLVDNGTGGVVSSEPVVTEPVVADPSEAANGMMNDPDGTMMMPGDRRGLGLDEWDLNWRLGQQFRWQGLELGMDYQMIRNNFQNLLYGGRTGQLLNLYGGYQRENLMVNYSQFYNWNLKEELDEKKGSFEFHWADPHWVHLYYSQYEKDTSRLQNGFAELGYLTEHDWGMLTYIMGMDVKHSGSTGTLLDGALPYLKLYYEKLPEQNVEAKLYGYNTEDGVELTRLQLAGKWNQGPLSWKGDVTLAPDYHRTNHVFQWMNLPTNLSLNLVQNRYYLQDQNYLSLDLQVDLTALLEAETRLQANIIRDQVQDEISQTYSLGGERALSASVTGYGEISMSDNHEAGRTYSAGVRGIVETYGWDVNYSWSSEPRDEGMDDLIQQALGFSFGSEDDLMIAGRYEVNNELYSVKELKVSDYILPQLKLNVSYTGQISKYRDEELQLRPWANHQLNLGTAYHF